MKNRRKKGFGTFVLFYLGIILAYIALASGTAKADSDYEAVCRVAIESKQKGHWMAPAHDIAGQTFLVTYRAYSTFTELRTAYNEAEAYFGRPPVDLAPGDCIRGFSVWEKIDDPALTAAFGGQPVTQCVVATTKPRAIDVTRTTDAGHEFLHCVYGNYHQ
jgi:hypothetical protein